MSGNLTHEEQATRAAALAAGVVEKLLTLSTLTLDNTTETPAEIVAKLRRFVRDRANVAVTRAAYEAAIAKANASEAEVVPVMGRLTAYVRAVYGNAADVLVAFGIAPVQPRTPLTAEEKVAANAKRESTRAARGVMGSRQRLRIHGDVTGVQITPVIAAGPGPEK